MIDANRKKGFLSIHFCQSVAENTYANTFKFANLFMQMILNIEGLLQRFRVLSTQMKKSGRVCMEANDL